MLKCIACSKNVNTNGSLYCREEEEDVVVTGTPRSKQAIKALTAQIKDIALKASGACKNCKSCSGSSNQNRNYADSIAAPDSARLQYSYHRSSNSISGLWEKETDTRPKALSSGEGTPASVSGRAESVVFMEEDEPKEWDAQVEPGVLITFISLPLGGNDLKRIRFSREMFNKWQAQRWWEENYDKVMELYNVQQLNHQAVPLPTQPTSEDEGSRIEYARDSPATPPLAQERPHNFHNPVGMGYSPSNSLCRGDFMSGPQRDPPPQACRPNSPTSSGVAPT